MNIAYPGVYCILEIDVTWETHKTARSEKYIYRYVYMKWGSTDNTNKFNLHRIRWLLFHSVLNFRCIYVFFNRPISYKSCMPVSTSKPRGTHKYTHTHLFSFLFSYLQRSKISSHFGITTFKNSALQTQEILVSKYKQFTNSLAYVNSLWIGNGFQDAA